MKIAIRQKAKLAAVSYDPVLDELEKKVLFPKKIEAAKEHLKKSGFPGIIPRQK